MGWRAASAQGRGISQSEDVSGEYLQARWRRAERNEPVGC